jgi:hypothetical protein
VGAWDVVVLSAKAVNSKIEENYSADRRSRQSALARAASAAREESG